MPWVRSLHSPREHQETPRAGRWQPRLRPRRNKDKQFSVTMDPGRFSNQDSSPSSMRGHRGIRQGDGEKSPSQQGSEGVLVNNCDTGRAMRIQRAGTMPQPLVKRPPLVLSPTGGSELPPEAIIRQELTREGSVGGGGQGGPHSF